MEWTYAILAILAILALLICVIWFSPKSTLETTTPKSSKEQRLEFRNLTRKEVVNVPNSTSGFSSASTEVGINQGEHPSGEQILPVVNPNKDLTIIIEPSNGSKELRETFSQPFEPIGAYVLMTAMCLVEGPETMSLKDFSNQGGFEITAWDPVTQELRVKMKVRTQSPKPKKPKKIIKHRQRHR